VLSSELLTEKDGKILIFDFVLTFAFLFIKVVACKMFKMLTISVFSNEILNVAQV